MLTKMGIATVTYNSEKHIHLFVQSLLRNKESIERVVFVDNGSTINISEYFKELNGIVLYDVISNKENKGYSEAINQGIQFLERAQVRRILVTNNDLLFKEGSLSVLLSEMESSNADVLGIPTTNDNHLYSTETWYSSEKESVEHVLLKREDIIERSKTTSIIPTGYVQGGVILFRDIFFKKIGYYDPFLFFGGDELDFLLRIHFSKHKINTSVSLSALDFFDHKTHHDNRFKLLKAKMMVRGIVYVLLKHKFYQNSGFFLNTISNLLKDLGKKSFKRYSVLAYFFITANIAALFHLRKTSSDGILKEI